jgi:hypothetical protein
MNGPGVARNDGGAELVDVVVLTRDGMAPPEPVRAAIAAQTGPGLTTHLHVVAGIPQNGDISRAVTIARARDAGKRRGAAPWLMFVDDDVLLGPGCIAALVSELRRRPGYAGLAADYLGATATAVAGADGIPLTRHVGLGATLFRREVLAFVNLRAGDGHCECQCLCDDLRRAGFGIGYLPGAEARHEPGLTRAAPAPAPAPAALATTATSWPPRVLTAFSRNHLPRFRRQFLTTFRAAGNTETVVAVTYGLHPSERRALAAIPGVEVLALPDDDDQVVPARRLRDFQTVVERLPEDTPVAYWDAGDILFQDRIASLWDLVRANLHRLLAVRGAARFPDSNKATNWVLSIADPKARRFAFELLSANPYLNGGFAAGTARTLLRYLRKAYRIRHSRAMHGSTNLGDQTVMNIYCHSDPAGWLELPAGWNYCIFQRGPRDFRITDDGRYVALDGSPIFAVHGNGRALRKSELSFLRDRE